MSAEDRLVDQSQWMAPPVQEGPRFIRWNLKVEDGVASAEPEAYSPLGIACVYCGRSRREAEAPCDMGHISHHFRRVGGQLRRPCCPEGGGLCDAAMKQRRFRRTG
jgi:hypothetical protein